MSNSPNHTKEPRKLSGGSDGLAREIAHLSGLSAGDLRQKWVALFGTEQSPRFGRSFMIRALAYRLQERALGGLKPATLRLLDRIAEDGSPTAAERVRRAGAGTVLIREWRGVSHRVVVLDDGVVYRGRRYKSLSEVARAITGTRWSGPLFFGLRRRAGEAAHG